MKFQLTIFLKQQFPENLNKSGNVFTISEEKNRKKKRKNTFENFSQWFLATISGYLCCRHNISHIKIQKKR